MATSTLQRPAMCSRQLSSSSFASEFDAARNKLAAMSLDEAVNNSKDEYEYEYDSASPSSGASDGSDGSDSDETLADPHSPAITPLTPVDSALTDSVADDFAFAFDIDGVLIRGGRPIPEAIEAMKMVNGENEYGIRVPYIFLTNGGGKFETERCRDLSKQLEMDVSPGQFICGHTPMREFADRYRTVLVIGGEGEKCRLVAESYGFRDVITPGDILKANAATAPFRQLTPAEFANSRDLRARVGATQSLSSIAIEAVFVFADSRDWACDVQIILDVAMSQGGRLETRSASLDEGPPIFFSHNDMVWSAAHEHARLGMGALRHIVETVFASVTHGRGKLRTYAFGKPQLSTFEFATRLLEQWRAQQHGLEGRPPRTVYFVGDTPESDIRGTNAMDASCHETEWYSCLVKTGVYQDGTEPAHKPRVTVDTVLDAVRHGIEREMGRRRTKLVVLDAGKGIEMGV